MPRRAHLLLACATLACGPKTKIEPGFPQILARFDYAPRQTFARWAMPGPNGKPRVWLQGSARATSVTIAGRDEQLGPPHYVKLVELEPTDAPIEIHFSDKSSHTLAPLPKVDYRGGDRAAAEFSFLSYGCVQPFAVADDGGFVFPGEDAPDADACPDIADPRDLSCVNVLARRLLEAVATTPSRVEYGTPEDSGLPVAEATKQPGALAPSALVLGTGDQVYLDAAYHSFKRHRRDHALSAWDILKRPPTRRANDFAHFVDEAYRAFWSFESLAHVHATLPAMLAWDDHEIRDGWGSEADPTYARTQAAGEYEIARSAYVDRQLSLGGTAPTADGPYMQTAVVQGVPIFVLETRSQRGRMVERDVPAACEITKHWLEHSPSGLQVLGAEQMCALENWLVINGRAEFVLVSNTPIFYDVRASTVRGLSRAFPEMRDDLLDAWGSAANAYERDMLIALLMRARDRGGRPIIISGDVHMSVPIVAWDCQDAPAETCAKEPKKANDACRVLAYEMVTTGLSNEDFAKFWLKGRRRTQVTNRGHVDLRKIKRGTPDQTLHRIDATVFREVAAPNFGAIDFRNDGTWLHHYEVAGGEREDVRLQRRSLLADFDRERCADIMCRPGSTLCNVRDPVRQDISVLPDGPE